MKQIELVICQNKTDAPNDGSPIILSEVIGQLEEDESNRIHDSLLNMDVSHGHDVPVYQIVANQLWNGVKFPQSSPRSMEILIQLYRHLSEQVTEDTEQIKSIGVSGVYLDFLRDFADQENLDLTIVDVAGDSHSVRSVAVRSMGWLIVSLFDAVLSLLLSPFFSSTDADVLVKYPIFRPDTFRPIETDMNIKFDSTFTLLTLSYFTQVKSVINEETNIIPIRCFETVPGMVRSYRFIISLIYDLVVTQRVETAVVDAVDSETGVRLERTLGQLVRRIVWTNMNTYLYHGAATQLFEREQYDSILLTSTGPSGKSLALPAVRRDVDIYCLPHGVRFQLMFVNDSLYDGVFTEGKIADRAVERKRTKFIPTGYPKHLDIYDRRDTIPPVDTVETLLLGTQPFEDNRRRAFIRDVVPDVLHQTEWNIIIKTHPRENISFYRRTLLKLGIDPKQTDRIQITDDDLYTWIGRSQLLLTIDSNVGIESVILDTPAACYNPWSPDIRDPLYAKYGPVPILRDPSELISLLTDWDGERERTHQKPAIDEMYMVRGNSIDKIIDRIQAEMTTPTEATRSHSDC